MNTTSLQQWIEHPELLNRDTLYELRTLVSRYPYFQTIRLLYLKNLYLLHDAVFGAELRKAVLFVPDRRVLFYLIEGDRFRLQPGKLTLPLDQFAEEEPSLDRTLTLIDAFLATVPDELTLGVDYTGASSAYSLEDAVEAPVATGSKLRGHELIDGFIERSTGELPATPDAPVTPGVPDAPDVSDVSEGPVIGFEEDDEESYFTETLAKIYVKQGRYAKALEIIRKLSLKYPKKNAYFADQIRFLEKLIINEKSK